MEQTNDEILLEFVDKLISSQIDLDGEIAEIVNNNFWDLFLETDENVKVL